MNNFREVPLLIDEDPAPKPRRYFAKNKVWAVAILFVCWTAGGLFMIPYDIAFWRLYLVQFLPAVGAVIYWVKFNDLK